MGAPPSGHPCSVDLADIFRFDAAGKLIEGWVIGKDDIKLALEAAPATSACCLALR